MAWYKKPKDVRLLRQAVHWQNIGRIVELDDATRADLVQYVIQQSFAAVNHAFGLIEDDASKAASLDEFRVMLEGRKKDAANAERLMLTRGSNGNPR